MSRDMMTVVLIRLTLNSQSILLASIVEIAVYISDCGVEGERTSQRKR